MYLIWQLLKFFQAVKLTIKVFNRNNRDRAFLLQNFFLQKITIFLVTKLFFAYSSTPQLSGSFRMFLMTKKILKKEKYLFPPNGRVQKRGHFNQPPSSTFRRLLVSSNKKRNLESVSVCPEKH